jgi:cold shock CspA family protein
MTTLLSRVKFFDSAKGFGFACPNAPGRPDVFLTDAVLRAAGVVDPKPGTPLAVTFDASHAKPRALVVRLSWVTAERRNNKCDGRLLHKMPVRAECSKQAIHEYHIDFCD